MIRGNPWKVSSMSPQADLEERIDRLEQILARAIERARAHPVGRQVLKILGLE